jgi:hypothetical protein
VTIADRYTGAHRTVPYASKSKDQTCRWHRTKGDSCEAQEPEKHNLLHNRADLEAILAVKWEGFRRVGLRSMGHKGSNVFIFRSQASCTSFIAVVRQPPTQHSPWNGSGSDAANCELEWRIG